MSTYGLTEEGFIIKTLSVIREELIQHIRSALGASLRIDDRSILGQLTSIVSELAALVWELAEAVNSAQDPNKASGAALDALCTLTGTFRPPATHSAVVLTLTGLPTTVVSEGSIVKTASTDISFETNAPGTITVLTAWAGATAYSIGDRRTNGGNAYQCITAGTSAASGGPTTTDASIPDGVGTLVWTYLGEGTGAIDVEGQAIDTGAIAATARDITVIDSLVGGWESVINLLDAEQGQDEASDEELRALREAELAGGGNTPIDALRADLLNVADVKACTIFVNNTDDTNVDGMPPHSVEALVRYDGAGIPPAEFDQSIWDALLANVAAGIQTHGLEIGTATDSQGTAHTMKFNRPTEIPIYVYISVLKDADEYPADGDALIKTAITDWGDAQLTGKDAVPSGVSAQAFEVDGVLAVNHVGISIANIATPTAWVALTAYSIGNVVTNAGRVYRCTTGGTSAASGGPSATGTGITDGTVTWAHLGETITISLRELATFDSSNIAVVSTSGVP